MTSSFSKTKCFFCFSLNKRSQKDTLGKLSFLHTLLLENKVQINKNNYATMLFMSKQVSLPKISLILQKIKIGPKCYICPFCTKAFNYTAQCNGKVWSKCMYYCQICSNIIVESRCNEKKIRTLIYLTIEDLHTACTCIIPCIYEYSTKNKKAIM